MGILNLEEQFTFYASYHANTQNKLIHIVCVWPILFTAIVFTEYLPDIASLAAPLDTVNNAVQFIHPFNVSFIVCTIYAISWILMDQRAGTLAGTLIFLCLIYAQKFYLQAETYTGYPAWLVALTIHVAGWIAQFIGHGVFEGRAPALLDSFVQAFLMAPLFVLLEVMFYFGYRKDLQKRMKNKVGVEITKFRKAKAALNSNKMNTTTGGKNKKK